MTKRKEDAREAVSRTVSENEKQVYKRNIWTGFVLSNVCY